MFNEQEISDSFAESTRYRNIADSVPLTDNGKWDGFHWLRGSSREEIISIECRCGRWFARSGKQDWCSRKCYQSFRHKDSYQHRPQRVSRACAFCRRIFVMNVRAKFCSASCRGKNDNAVNKVRDSQAKKRYHAKNREKRLAYMKLFYRKNKHLWGNRAGRPTRREGNERV